MIKKLYIPTTTFNFNNILSSESISPHAFYERRGFGYPRWMNIKENNLENAILLYEYPFCFSRPQSDMEDHPMLIEFTTDKDFPTTEVEGILYCDHTLYLTPWNTKFIFFCEKDYSTTLSLSDNSLETKLIHLYRKQFVVNNNYSDCDIKYANMPVELNENEIEKDFRINKMKGLLIGYYIGANLSQPLSLTKRYQLLSKLNDISSAILSTEGHQMSETQENSLHEILDNLNIQLPAISWLSTKFSNKKNLTEGLERNMLGNGCSIPGFISPTSFMESLRSSEKYEKALILLHKLQTELDEKETISRKLLSPDSEEIVATSNRLSKISEKVISDRTENLIFATWINDVFSSHDYNGKISIHCEAISDAITYKSKDILDGEWEGSFWKKELNQIRKYIRGQEDSICWDNLLLASVTAVLTKGNDWEELLNFMKRKSICNYRIAFAIYGVLNGFANLTRDFTDNLYKNASNYVADVYKEIYGQLFGEDILDTSVTAEGVQPYLQPSLSCNDMLSSRIRDIWHTIKDTLKKPKKEKDMLEALLEEAIAQINNDKPEKFLDILCKKAKWGTKTGAWKKMKEELCPSYTPTKKSSKKKSSRNKDTSLSLFAGQYEPNETTNNTSANNKKKTNTLCFYEDDDAWDYISPLILNEKDKEKLKNDFDWFIGEIRKKPEERVQYYKDVDAHSNERVIHLFCTLKQKPNKYGGPQAPYFSNDLRVAVENKLKSIYANR